MSRNRIRNLLKGVFWSSVRNNTSIMILTLGMAVGSLPFNVLSALLFCDSVIIDILIKMNAQVF